MRSALSRTRTPPGSLRMYASSITTDKTCDTTVAQATPRTPMFRAATETKFSATFTTPDTISTNSGYRVSPVARSAADANMYTAAAGRPRK